MATKVGEPAPVQRPAVGVVQLEDQAVLPPFGTEPRPPGYHALNENGTGPRSPPVLVELDIDAILLVGGSTLLPGVRELFEGLFGAQRVHYWEPFEAVVKGAAVFGAGFSVDQIIHHDYAVRVYSDSQQRPEYERLVKRNTGYPTPNGFETRYYAVTEGQQTFRLPICEVGYGGRLSLPWNKRMNGNEYWLPSGAEEGECVVTLNEGDALRLAPPGSGAQARLRIDFTIDADRFLCATIHDLLKQRDLKTEDRVVMLR